MVFSSLEFLFVFLPISLLLYYIVPQKLKNFVLVCVSLVFYAWGEPRYILIMLFSTIFDYVNGLLIHKFRGEKKDKYALAVLITSLVGNLGILCFFKYSDFIISNINNISGSAFGLLGLPLPIGISFYTFQTLSYTIDVYRGEVETQHNIIDFAAYVTLFPQLVAGPIVQYKDVERQMRNRVITADSFAGGVQRFIQGMFKKVMLANNIGIIWKYISASQLETLPVATVWLGACAFAFQIYFDFSGYSDMAIGLGKMFGFHFRENFNLPYRSKSISEFWRRWHISLGQWFKDYVYIPLGGSRCSKVKLIRNILVVWFLTGLWHGASWNFVLWGLYFAFFLIIEKCVLKKILEKIPGVLAWGTTFFFILISWMIFAFEDLKNVVIYIKAMFGLNGNQIWNTETLYLLQNNVVLLLACTILAFGMVPEKYLHRLSENRVGSTLKPAVLIMLFLLSISFLVGETYNPFLYFRF